METGGPDALDVVVIGAIGVDTNVVLAGADIDFSVEVNFSENRDYVGQAGGYGSRGFARLGKRTGFIGYIGDDHNGRLVAAELDRDEIRSLLFVDPRGTRRSINLMYRDGRRKNIYDGRGAMEVHPHLAPCRELLRGAPLAHVNIENWARYLLPPARELGLTISCDLQDLISLTDPYRQDFIEYADILFFSSANIGDPSGVMRQLIARKPDLIIVVGMGSQGCALGTREGVRFFGPVSLDGPVVDTNGAGDGLAVGFLAGYCLDGFSLEESVLRGQIAARYKCMQKATSSQLISSAQLDAYYRQLRGG
jgi:sugar/nucleoside kinase (ribokinase family)